MSNLEAECRACDAVMRRWAMDCLQEAIENGRLAEMPYYFRAIRHLGFSQTGIQVAVATAS